jgi:myo-inositol 2-dehydrogenase/D-chiro-inositol 1-dehydrogenase
VVPRRTYNPAPVAPPESTGGDGPLRIGIVGLGQVTEAFHLPALARLPQARVVAAADVDPGRREAISRRFGIPRRYADVRDLAADPDVEAVAVCVPPWVHLQAALVVLEAGKHLFVEKPLASSLEECDVLIRRARGFPGRILVGFNLRHHRHLRRARDVVRSGAVGALQTVRSAFTSMARTNPLLPRWRTRSGEGGGVLKDFGVHHFDLWRFLTGEEVEEVQAFSRTEDEVTVVAARLSGGVLACAVLSQHSALGNEIDVYGQSGVVRISGYRFDGLEVLSSSLQPGDVRARLHTLMATLSQLPTGLRELRRGGTHVDSYRAEWEHFIAAVRRGAPTECSFEDGRAAVAIALAAEESCRTGQPVRPGVSLASC